MNDVIRFQPEPEAVRARPGTVLSGNPEQTIRNVYTDPSGAFSAGIWESTPGKWPVSYTEEEFCLLLSGLVVLPTRWARHRPSALATPSSSEPASREAGKRSNRSGNTMPSTSG